MLSYRNYLPLQRLILLVKRLRKDGEPYPLMDVPAVVLEWGLGAGETAVIAAAWRAESTLAVLDDAQGRKCARALGVPVIGTLGVVLRAKKMGCVASVTSILRDLRDAGLYLDPTTIATALEQSVGEEWRP